MSIDQHYTKLAYTKEQLRLYLNRIDYFEDGESQNQDIQANYDTLERIVRCQANTIPYGNLSYVYYKRLEKPEGNYPCDFRDPLTTQGASTDLQDIFKKLVIEERDGSCMECNPLCAHMLMTIGFNAYLTSTNNVETSVWDESGVVELRANLHCGTVVELEGKEYFMDVGTALGRNPKPLLMEEGLIQQGNPLTEFKVSRAPYPSIVIQSTNPKQIPWLLETRAKKLPNSSFTKKNEWSPMAYINMAPIYLKEMQIMNDMSAGLKVSKLFRSVIILTVDTDEGFITLRNNTLKIYSLDGVKTIKLKSEKERRNAFLKYFNTKVPEDHKEHLPSYITNEFSQPPHNVASKL